MKYFSLFSGIGGFDLGIDKATNFKWECIGYSEIDKYASGIYEYHYPKPTNYGDITTVKSEDLPDFDFLCAGFPCFVGQTLILSRRGFIPISEIAIGDYVYTHKQRWRKVTNKFTRKSEIQSVKATGFLEIKTTSNHPFYIRERCKKWNNSKRCYDFWFNEPEWKEAESIKNCYAGSTYVKDEYDFGDEDFWWIVGTYIGDGWLVNRKNRGNGGVARVVIRSSYKEADKLEERIRRKFNCTKVEERTVVKFHIQNKKFARFLEPARRGASNKTIPTEWLSLPRNKIRALLDGYIFADGAIKRNVTKTVSTSRALTLGMSMLIHKAYGINTTIQFVKRSNKHIIEGRTVNQRNYWQLSIPKRNRSGIVEDEFRYGLVRKSESTGIIESVFNLEVEEDNSYIADGYIVHNCQAFSIAGKRKGFSDTRGTLFFEIARILKDKQPSYFLLENVKGLLNHQKGQTYTKIIQTLDELQYEFTGVVCNSKFHGVPQNRERIFIIGYIRGKPRLQILPFGEDAGEISRIYQTEGSKSEIGQATVVLNMQKRDINRPSIKKRIDTGLKPNAGSGYLSKEDEAYCLDAGCNQCIARCLDANQYKGCTPETYFEKKKRNIIASRSYPRTGTRDKDGNRYQNFEPQKEDCCNSLTNVQKDNLLNDCNKLRRLTPIECERLQGFPDDWTKYGIINGKTKLISNTQRYKTLGNAISVPVVEDIIKQILIYNEL